MIGFHPPPVQMCQSGNQNSAFIENETGIAGCSSSPWASALPNSIPGELSCTGSPGESLVFSAGQPLSLSGKDPSRIYAFCSQASSGRESRNSWIFPKFRSQKYFPPPLGRATEGWREATDGALATCPLLHSPQQPTNAYAFPGGLNPIEEAKICLRRI